MSTFNGLLEEIPEISVDRFQYNNMKSTAFFLSHCHSDHMKGLSENCQEIANKNSYLYGSLITITILKQKHPVLTPILKPLDLYAPTLINIHSTKNKLISVRTIPAGHCPGSVMFLFEIDDNQKILYTGDYRINPEDFNKIKQFYDNDSNKIIDISHLYLDTSFFNQKYKTFPQRDECVSEICKCIKEWIEKSPENVINIVNSAYYGSEYLYLEIFKAIKMPIHISQKMYEEYKYFPDLDGIFTLESNTQIHSSCARFKGICVNKNVRKIIPSAMYWTSDENKKMNNDEFRFCYSCHPSFNETVAFIKFLKPKKISFNVLPGTEEEIEEMRRITDDLIKSEEGEVTGSEMFPLEKIKRKKRNICNLSKEEEDLLS